jgi:hypothetical protein
MQGIFNGEGVVGIFVWVGPVSARECRPGAELTVGVASKGVGIIAMFMIVLQ